MKKSKWIVALLSLIIVLVGCNSQTQEKGNDNVEQEIVQDQMFNERYEAEESILAGDLTVATTRDGYSGNGYVTNFSQNPNNKWELVIEVPKEQHYTLEIYAAADAYKVNKLLVNGEEKGAIECLDDDRAFRAHIFDGIYLTEGKNTLAIQEEWGWFDLDAVVVREGSAVAEHYYKDVCRVPVNANANEKTKNIMNFLADEYGKRVITGQYTDEGKSIEVEAIYYATGKYPAMRGFDFLFYTPSVSMTGKDTEKAIEWSNKGGLVTFSWHWFAPKNEAEFYSEKTSFDLSKGVTDLDIATKSLEELKVLMENGEITEETYLLVRDLDVISEELKILQDNDVTVLWRPLHEAHGGWFWWGTSGKDAYLWLWNLMYERQTTYHGLNNLIWVWNAQSIDWYPGDDVVDIIGDDIYANPFSYDPQTKRFLDIAQPTPDTKKIVALTECGVIPDPDLMQRENVMWSWFNVWNGEFIIKPYGGQLSETHTSREMLEKVYNHPLAITLDQLPQF